MGMAVKAFVSLVQGSSLTARDILRYCAQHLEDFMVPREVEFREELPKTESGKIRKRELLDGVDPFEPKVSQSGIP